MCQWPLSSHQVINSAALMVASMTHLHHVELVVTDINTTLTDEEKCVACEEALLMLLRSLPQDISHLSLTGLEALNAGLCDALAGMPHLSSLSLRNVSNVSMDVMLQLVGCSKSLRKLHVVACEGFGSQQCKDLERGHKEHDFRAESEEYDLTRWDSV